MKIDEIKDPRQRALYAAAPSAGLKPKPQSPGIITDAFAPNQYQYKDSIRFVVTIVPKSVQFGGKRMSTRGGKVRFFRSSEAQSYLDELGLLLKPFRPAKPWEGPLRVDVIFFLPRPKSLKTDPTIPMVHASRPDRDNLFKTLADAMTHEGFWLDDAQICTGNIGKFYGRQGNPGCIAVDIVRFS